MKANQFMVGDWVLTDEGTPARIAQVNDCYYDGYSSDLMLENGDNYRNVQPIPLSKEIFEKNGFNINHYDNGELLTAILEKSGEYSVVYHFDCQYFHIDGYEGVYGNFGKLYFRYVHELQHALRLCGIDKEITL